MIRIEHLSFDLTAPDEEFAQGLYAGWDAFCRDCVERVLDECLSPYDRERTLREIGRLDLDLGGIPEEDFYREFPKRLREELLKNIPQWNDIEAQTGVQNVSLRSDNLLHYMEYGYPPAEWADTDFSMEAELEWLSEQSDNVLRPAIKRLALLCLKREYALRRLLWQATDGHILLQVFSLALAEPSAGNKEKRRLLAMLLEVNPDIPLRFVHETNDEARLREMSVLLDTLSVRQLIRTETKEHAEVDLPPYWHYLYEWLIRYYPYNGIAMFGGKTGFTRHLHHRLLTFIHKRNGAPYLSKAELTVSFLLEVFGPAYYRDVLNAIYLLQPHNPDGSPVYDSYFNLELYRTFLRLSLLKLPEATQEGFAADKKQEKKGTKETQWQAEPETVTVLLTDTHTDDREKHNLLLSFVQNYPESLIQWLQSEGVKSPELLSVLARLADKGVLDRLLASLSFAVWEQVAKAESHIRKYKSEIPLLKDVPDGTFHTALRKSILVWISQKHYNLPEEESIRRLLLAFYYELNGTADKGRADNRTDREHEKDMETLSAAILSEGRQPLHVHVDIEELARILKDPARSDAYKRMLWTMLVREQPEALIQWLQSAYPKDNALLSLLAELSDDATINRLFAAYSLATLDRITALREYMETHREGIVWLKEIPETRLAFTFRQSALRLLISDTSGQSNDTKDVLRLIYLEVTGGDRNEEVAVETIARELKEAGFQTAFHEMDASTGKHSITLQDLLRMMHDSNLSEAAKRRTVASYWDNHRENPMEAVRLLQKRDMLDKVLELTGYYAWESILYRTLRQVVGMEKVSDLMPLFQCLAAHETSLSSYRTDNDHSLRTGLLIGIVRWEQDGQNKPLQDAIRSLLVSLFREDSLSIIRKQLVQATAIETAGVSDAEQSFAWLDVAFDGEYNNLSSLYQEWLHGMENASNAIQMLFEHRWNTAESFATWLDDTSIPIATKREQLREAAQEKPQAWLQQLRALPLESRASASLETLMTVQDLLQAVAKVNFYQATVLSRVMEKLRHTADQLPLFPTRSHTPLKSLLWKALLAYLQDPETWVRTWGEKDITGTFLRYLRLAATGKEQDDTDNIEWLQLAGTITDGNPEADSQPKENLLKSLADPSATHAVLRQTLDRLMDRHPEALRTWLEQEASNDSIARIAEATDYIQVSHWADELARTPSFAHPDAFLRLTGWLLQRIPLKELATALFLYVREPDWQAFTPEQMEAYFFSRLYGSTDVPPVMETLTDGSLPEKTRKRLFRRLLRYRPEKLLAFIRESVLRNTLPLDKWLEWTDTADWLYLAASLSLPKAELLRQITESLSLPEEERKKALATYIIYGDTEEWLYATPQETVHDFIGMLPSLQEADNEKKEETVRRVEAELALPETETPVEEELPEALTVGNAGLCLLAPWFVRLFAMLGWLDEERKKFRNTASKVRAVFLLQYTVCGEEREWREGELAFNRLLTNLPGNVPLPGRLPLTEEERQTADSMVVGVKANWPQMGGTSVEGFRGSFLLREGTLEQEEERWLLTVEEKAYDILLETVPWGFKQIRLPWLKKHVQVRWHEKQEF
ncbi:contractile injection system tape measure protein [Bacteroides sp. An19]|uniref:contractile injection system tape measure protein n=1 Tax=Bacteroides sp. An19 TaxID=1965580 RepID=UPI000B367D9E|nr:contractile injection system tape measure protein [Bacteroides sp. An19]OUP30519.1 hypothetical protein B5F25_14520 [Bacteroides sp. An19]